MQGLRLATDRLMMDTQASRDQSASPPWSTSSPKVSAKEILMQLRESTECLQRPDSAEYAEGSSALTQEISSAVIQVKFF